MIKQGAVYICLMLLIGIPCFSQENLKGNNEPIRREFSLLFPVNKSTLSDTHKNQLQEIVSTISSKTISYTISITGHTDSDGITSYNQELSEARAQEVRDFFISQGIDKELIVMEAMGENAPIAKNKTPYGKQRNRRVTILISYQLIEIDVPVLVDKEEVETIENIKTAPIQLAWDTVVTGEYGSKIRFPKDYFGSYNIKHITVILKEAYTPCQILSQGLNTMSNVGSCMQTGGMVNLQVRYKGLPLEADSTKKIEVWIPTDSPDKEMSLYIPTENGWQSFEGEVAIQQENGKFFYVFESTVQKGWNIDKIAGPCPYENGPQVKTRFGDENNITFAYGNDIFTNSRKTERPRIQEMPKVPASFKSPNVVAIAVRVGNARRKECTYIASVPLEKLKYKPAFNRYVLKRKYYKRFFFDQDSNRQEIIANAICPR